MAKIKLVIKQSADPKELGKGEAIIYSRHSPTHSFAIESEALIFGCPRCAHVSTGTHIYDRATQTISSSIKCEKCKYHGNLTNGIFTDV